MSRRAAQKKHGVPVEAEKLRDAQGRELVCVTVANSRPFARACIELMIEADGRDHRPKLGWKSFWTTKDITELARQRVEEEARQRAEERI